LADTAYKKLSTADLLMEGYVPPQMLCSVGASSAGVKIKMEVDFEEK
jgi:hypothetical protein